jgi:hypothetical protein
MAGEYTADCGCKIHVIQWTSKRKVVTQESCPLHKHAKEVLEVLKELSAGMWAGEGSSLPCVLGSQVAKARAAISKSEGK